MPTKTLSIGILALALTAGSSTYAEAAKPAKAEITRGTPAPRVTVGDRVQRAAIRVGLASPTIGATAMTVAAYPHWHEAQAIVAVSVGAINYGVVKGAQKVRDVVKNRAGKRSAATSGE